jgi:hypothetical protein
MVLNTKNQFSYCFIFYFHFAIFSQNGIVRKLAGLANQHKKLVLLGTIGVLLMSTVKPMLMQFSDALCPV